MNKNFIDLESILAVLPGHVYWLDRNNVYQGCNDLQAKSAGLSNRNEVVGKRNKDLPWNWGKVELVKALDAVNKEVMDTGSPAVIEELGYSILDGSQRNYVSHKIPLSNAHGEIVGLLGVSLDITDSKVKEESFKRHWSATEFALENILANMPGHVYWKDKYGVYLGCNDRQAKSLGLLSGQELIGKTDFELPWPEGMAEIFWKNDLQVMETGKMKLVEESAKVDGRDSTVLSQKTPLYNQQGEIVGILGISIDITKLKETEGMLKQAKEKAEAANKAKTDFLAVVSHELRTPLTGIIGMADILQHEKTTEKEQQEYVENINVASKHLLSLINEILDFAKLDENRFYLAHEPFDLRVTVHKVIDILRNKAEEKELQLKLQLADSLPNFLVGDAKALMQILLNVIGNAIKFTEAGHIDVVITASRVDSEHIQLAVTIEDTGIGIPEDKKEKIFERFMQVDASHTRAHGGTGLGLAVTKRMIDLMRGKIMVQSELGKGSKFLMELPFEVISQIPKAEALVAVGSPPQKKLTAKKILLVEDDPLIQVVHQHKLEMLGHTVVLAKNGQDALASFAAQPFDIVFMDIGLPDISGNEVIQKMRAEEKTIPSKHTPIIALTAYSDKENYDRSMEAGADNVLSKPTDDGKLQEVLA